MEIWQAIVLGFVQGFAEFLPISSSGHLMLLQNWFGITEGAFFFTMLLHIGTLIPVIIVLFKDCLELFKKPKRFFCLVLATCPAGLLGLAISLFIDLDSAVSNNIWILSIMFLITACAMVFSEWYSKKHESQMTRGINWKTALGMGLGQMFGTLPGVSRSGSTIVGATLSKVEKNERAVFTFIMSITTILATLFLEVLKKTIGGEGFGEIEILPCIFGILTSAVCGYIAIKFMLKFIRKANYKWFAAYLVILSIVNLIIALI